MAEIADEEHPPWATPTWQRPRDERQRGGGGEMRRHTGKSAGASRVFLTLSSPDGSVAQTGRVEESARSGDDGGLPAADTILIVDDDAADRALLEAILTGAGYQVWQAERGVAALTQATVTPPDLILLDLLMPGMGGLEACRRLKEHPTTSRVPIIVVTALDHVTAKEASLTIGAEDFVTKPVRPDDLRARVHAMLKVRRIRQEIDRTLAYLHELAADRDAQRLAALTTVDGRAPAKPPARLTALPILLADDEAFTREFYEGLLTEHGFRVLAASDGVAALALVREHPVEVALLDLMMPGMSGLEVLERLHARDPDLPVIVLTAHATSRNAIAALKLGAFDFIVKGLDHDLVVLAVHRAVRHRHETQARNQEIERLRLRVASLEALQPPTVAPMGS